MKSGNPFLRHRALFALTSFIGNVNIIGNSLVRVTNLLLETGLIDPKSQDDLGNTPLLQIQHLLRRNLFQEAADIANLILTDERVDVDHVNRKNRSLLSYSVTYADKAVGLTRLLLNTGAGVWPAPDTTSTSASDDVIQKLTTEREQSSFTWFLRSLMDRSCYLDQASGTLYLLGTKMGEEPVRMKNHVFRTMLHLGKGAARNGALFLQLKLSLMQYWCRPQDLKYQCLKRVRSTVGPKRLARGAAARLPLPARLQRYVLLEQDSGKQ